MIQTSLDQLGADFRKFYAFSHDKEQLSIGIQCY